MGATRSSTRTAPMATIGRGGADILLDNSDPRLENLISRVHCTFHYDAATMVGPMVECHSMNQIRLEGRSGAQVKPTKNVKRNGERALLTPGRSIIFGSCGSRDEFAYVVTTC